MTEIQERFNSVISKHTGIPEPKTDKLFELWKKNKEYFFKLFGGEIYECPTPISIEHSDAEKKRMFIDFLKEIKYDLEDNDELIEYLLEIGFNSFFNNIVPEDYKGIKKGTKLLKSFKHFITNNNLLRVIQDKASMYIQKNKITGKLCLSVHPLDYLTISENNHNWTSCHAMDGDYAAGNLGYMIDGATFVAYIKSKDKMTLPDGSSWNSKKWRQLIFLSDDRKMCLFSRQYPFNLNKEIENKILSLFRICGDEIWSCYLDKIISQDDFRETYDSVGGYIGMYGEYLPIENELVNLVNLIHTNNSGLYFSDILSSREKGYAYNLGGADYWTPTKLNWYTSIGSTFFNINNEKIPCLRCGEHELDYGYLYHCSYCEVEYGNCDNDDFCYCDNCGEHIREADSVYIDEFDGTTICMDCYKEHVSECYHCGVELYTSNMKYDEEEDRMYCRDCWEEVKKNG